MWREHKGKILSGVITPVILAMFWGIWTIFITVIDVKAGEWVEKKIAEKYIIIAQNYESLKRDIDENTGAIKKQQSGTRTQLYDLQRDIKILNNSIIKLLADRNKQPD